MNFAWAILFFFCFFVSSFIPTDVYPLIISVRAREAYKIYLIILIHRPIKKLLFPAFIYLLNFFFFALVYQLTLFDQVDSHMVFFCRGIISDGRIAFQIKLFVNLSFHHIAQHTLQVQFYQ